MFNWFRPHCPVNDAVRSWVDWRMDWLIRQFGPERLSEFETILPIADHFPADYNASHEAVRALFDQVCEYLDIDGARLELACYSEGRGQNHGSVQGSIEVRRASTTSAKIERSSG